jgi:hypothetical protein
LETITSLLSLTAVAAQPFTEVAPSLAKPPLPCVVWGNYDGDGANGLFDVLDVTDSSPAKFYRAARP